MFGKIKGFKDFSGDRTLFALVLLMMLMSITFFYSASSNLAYIGRGDGSTFGYLIKHIVFLFIGLGLMFFFMNLNFRVLKGLSFIGLIASGILLAAALIVGKQIGGANASRWISLGGFTVQPSAFANGSLLTYLAFILSTKKNIYIKFNAGLGWIWLPVAIVLGMILPSNLSTVVFIGFNVFILVIIAGYPFRFLSKIMGFGLIFLILFYGASKAFPDVKFFNRVSTWENRIKNFSNDKVDPDADYQIEKSKTAIACGELFGKGPGKSGQKPFLPQSSSDFIFAIIVEEYGLFGAVVVTFIYGVLLIRFGKAYFATNDLFQKYLVVGLGFSIIMQAIINMCVAVGIFPVTGQPLPMISSGGSSVFALFISFGIILNITKQIKANKEKVNKKKSEENLGEYKIQESF